MHGVEFVEGSFQFGQQPSHPIQQRFPFTTRSGFRKPFKEPADIFRISFHGPFQDVLQDRVFSGQKAFDHAHPPVKDTHQLSD